METSTRRFQSGRLIPPLLPVLGLLAWSLPGCGGGPAPSPPAIAAAQPPWSEQIEAVRAGRSREIRVEQHAVTRAEWDALRDGCAALAVLDVERAAIDDADLAALAALPNLKRLRLDASVGDAGLAHLAACRGLAVLNLPAAEFSDAGLERLSHLPYLELLRFHSPHVTDAGLTHIAAMTSLRFLHLIDVPVTDGGLAHLHEMTGLESFYLDGGQCTDEGLSALLQALPELHFHKDQLHLPGDPRAHPHK